MVNRDCIWYVYIYVCVCGRYKRRLGSNINDNLADDAMLLAGNIEQLCSLCIKLK